MDRKKELANIRRLQSLKEKKHERSIQAKQIKSSLCNLDSKPILANKRIVFQSDDESDATKECIQDENKKREETNTMRLFDSDGEDSSDEDVDRFRVRPHLQQEKKLEFLEETGDERFQLNDIFMEDMEEEEQEQMAESDEEKDEKKKNLDILQSILGFQLSKTVPTPPAAKKMKKYVHFNPEDEESLKYLKKVESKAEKTGEKKEETTTTTEPQVSPLRYFEVSADLKSVLEGTDGEFRFSKTFGFSNEPDEANDNTELTTFDTKEKRSQLHDQSSTKSKEPTIVNANLLSLTSAPKTDCGTKEHQKFFILSGDNRLTEGIQFFKREKTEEQIREDFFKTRDTILEILKQRHRRGIRAHRVVKNKNKNR